MSYSVATVALKVVVPADPCTAKGLLLASIDDPDPVIFMEPMRVYRAAGGVVPEGAYHIPLGQAAVDREGAHCTIISYGAALHECRKAAELLADNDISAEIIDLRTLVPLDEETVLESVRKTGRVVIVHEAARTGGFGGELAAVIAEKA